MRIEPVSRRTFEKLLPLIADYQRFYRVVPHFEKNRQFFSQFLASNAQGAQFIALDDQENAVGFAALYFLPSSLSAGQFCVLNDLYTVAEKRGEGVGKSLIDYCGSYARQRGFMSLEWQTEQSNAKAQKLYDKLGTSKSPWLYYSLDLVDRNETPPKEIQ